MPEPVKITFPYHSSRKMIIDWEPGEDYYVIPAARYEAMVAVCKAVENSEEEWGYQMPDVWEALAAYKEAHDGLS